MMLARSLALSFTAAVSVVVLVGACSSKFSAVGRGGECFLATDCAPGLVCLEQPNKTRVCGDDLTNVTGRLPPDGGGAQDAAVAEEGGLDGALDAAQPAPVDSGERDTGTTEDTGTPPTLDASDDG
jgi:hypothetical protein